MSRPRFAVLISGGGTNLQAILDDTEQPDFPGEIGLVISNRRDAYGLVRAEKIGVKSLWVPHRKKTREAFEEDLIRALEEHDIEWIVLAGFMRILSPHFLSAFPGRVLNIHPSLLPAFPGMHAQRQALEHGCSLAGATVHYVDAGLDSGPIVVQGVVPVRSDDDEGSLKKRILRIEHRIYPMALRWALEGRLKRQGRTVTVDNGAPKFVYDFSL